MYLRNKETGVFYETMTGLDIAPLGGGLLLSVSVEDVLDKFELVAEIPLKLRPGKVYFMELEGFGPFDCYIEDGMSWNGWVCPWFDVDQSWRLVQAADGYGLPPLVFDAEKNAYMTPASEAFEGEVFEAKVIDGRVLYPIGNRSWIWDEFTEPTEDDDEDV